MRKIFAYAVLFALLGAASQIMADGLDQNQAINGILSEKLDSIIAPWRANHSKGLDNLDRLYGSPEKIIDLKENILGLVFPEGPFRDRNQVAETLVSMIEKFADTYKRKNIDFKKLRVILVSQNEKKIEGIATYKSDNPEKIFITVYPKEKNKYKAWAEYMRPPTRINWINKK